MQNAEVVVWSNFDKKFESNWVQYVIVNHMCSIVLRPQLWSNGLGSRSRSEGLDKEDEKEDDQHCAWESSYRHPLPAVCKSNVWQKSYMLISPSERWRTLATFLSVASTRESACSISAPNSSSILRRGIFRTIAKSVIKMWCLSL